MKKNFYPKTLTTVETTSNYSTKTEETVITDLYVYGESLLYNKVIVGEHNLLNSENKLEIIVNNN